MFQLLIQDNSLNMKVMQTAFSNDLQLHRDLREFHLFIFHRASIIGLDVGVLGRSEASGCVVV